LIHAGLRDITDASFTLAALFLSATVLRYADLNIAPATLSRFPRIQSIGFSVLQHHGVHAVSLGRRQRER
jgi:hypothetical protein